MGDLRRSCGTCSGVQIWGTGKFGGSCIVIVCRFLVVMWRSCRGEVVESYTVVSCEPVAGTFLKLSGNGRQWRALAGG
jgi:hypothetical protein